jgi:hypothetical protein
MRVQFALLALALGVGLSAAPVGAQENLIASSPEVVSINYDQGKRRVSPSAARAARSASRNVGWMNTAAATPAQAYSDTVWGSVSAYNTTVETAGYVIPPVVNTAAELLVGAGSFLFGPPPPPAP